MFYYTGVSHVVGFRGNAAAWWDFFPWNTNYLWFNSTVLFGPFSIWAFDRSSAGYLLFSTWTLEIFSYVNSRFCCVIEDGSSSALTLKLWLTVFFRCVYDWWSRCAAPLPQLLHRKFVDCLTEHSGGAGAGRGEGGGVASSTTAVGCYNISSLICSSLEPRWQERAGM